MEKKLLAALIQSREAFDTLRTKIDKPEKALSDVGRLLYEHISHFYAVDKQAQQVDLEVMAQRIEIDLDNEKQFNRIKPSIDELAVSVSVPNILAAYIEQKKYSVGQEMAAAILGGDNKKARNLMLEWSKLDQGELEESESAEVFENINIENVLAPLNRDNLIKLYPKSLNEQVDGGAVPGDHIVIAGRVENGKSLISINMACGLCHDGHRVLYIGNEDAPARMIPRFVSRLSGMTKQEVLHNYQRAQQLANQNGLQNLIFVSLPGGTLPEIEGLIDRYKPDVLVIDQLRNIDVGEKDSKNGQLEKAAVGVRFILKKYHILGISITQAVNSDMHINKLVGDNSDIADSKVGLPAQADLLIVLGTNEEFRQNNQIMLSITKNKMSGWHGYFPVRINPFLSKVEDII